MRSPMSVCLDVCARVYEDGHTTNKMKLNTQWNWLEYQHISTSADTSLCVHAVKHYPPLQPRQKHVLLAHTHTHTRANTWTHRPWVVSNRQSMAAEWGVDYRARCDTQIVTSCIMLLQALNSCLQLHTELSRSLSFSLCAFLLCLLISLYVPNHPSFQAVDVDSCCS